MFSFAECVAKFCENSTKFPKPNKLFNSILFLIQSLRPPEKVPALALDAVLHDLHLRAPAVGLRLEPRERVLLAVVGPQIFQKLL